MEPAAQVILSIFVGVSLLVLACNTTIEYTSDKKDDNKSDH